MEKERSRVIARYFYLSNWREQCCHELRLDVKERRVHLWGSEDRLGWRYKLGVKVLVKRLWMTIPQPKKKQSGL